jgi:hypothetical protein
VKALARTSLERLLGLRINLAVFDCLAEADPKLRVLAQRFRGLKPPRFPTIFEALANAIACQQMSLSLSILPTMPSQPVACKAAHQLNQNQGTEESSKRGFRSVYFDDCDRGLPSLQWKKGRNFLWSVPQSAAPPLSGRALPRKVLT